MNCDFCGETLPPGHYAIVTTRDGEDKSRIHWKCIPFEESDDMCNTIVHFDESKSTAGT